MWEDIEMDLENTIKWMSGMRLLYGKKKGSISRSIEIFTVVYLDTHI